MKILGKNKYVRLVALYLAVVLTGLALSIAYIITNHYSPNIILCFFSAIIFSCILAFAVTLISTNLKIDNKPGAIMAVLLGIITFSYFKWNLFFTFNWIRFSYQLSGYNLSPIGSPELIIKYFVAFFKSPLGFFDTLLYFNRVGTWNLTFQDTTYYVTRQALFTVWAVEFIMFAGAAVKFCFHGKSMVVEMGDDIIWADVNFSDGSYKKIPLGMLGKLKSNEMQFEQGLKEELIKELDRIKSDRALKYNKFAFFSVNGEKTGYVAVYAFTEFKGKFLRNSMRGKPVFIGVEKAGQFEMLLNHGNLAAY